MDRLRHLLLLAYSSARYQLSRRASPAGRLALGAFSACAVLSLDTRQSMAYEGAAFLLSLFALALLSNLGFSERFEAGRRLPRLATAGERLPYTAWVRKRGGTVARGLAVIEEVEDPRPSFKEYESVAEIPGANWVERATGYSRWRKSVSTKRIAAEALTPLPDLRPGELCEVSVDLIAARRGILRLRALTVARPDVFGFFNAFARQEAEQNIIVLPKRYPAPRLELSGDRRYQPGGISLSSAVGDSQEFMALRDYRPGDPLRRIHWRSWAKTGHPMVKDYEDEFFVRHALILDTFAAPGGEEAFEEAVSVAASFACSLLTQESLLDLLFVGERSYCFTAGRGLGGPESLLEVLACAPACSDKPFAELTRSVESRGELLSGCLCVLLAADEGRLALVRSLRARGVPVRAVVVASARSLPDALCLKEGLHRLEPGRIAEDLAKMAARS